MAAAAPGLGWRPNRCGGRPGRRNVSIRVLALPGLLAAAQKMLDEIGINIFQDV
jgi:hypothetical protein